jgi:hypothetical protein
MYISKIAMSIREYDKVVSRWPVFGWQNINARAPLEFIERLEVVIVKR